MTKSRKLVESAGRELRDNPPSVLEKTRRKKGAKAARKQEVAIMLSKARSRGAKIPQRKRG